MAVFGSSSARRCVWSVVLVMVVLALASCAHHAKPAPQTMATVPSVRDTTPVQAQRALRDAGLVLVGFHERCDPAVEKGMIATSDPAPGKRVPAGASVVLIVSSGAPPKPEGASTREPAVHKAPVRIAASPAPVTVSHANAPSEHGARLHKASQRRAQAVRHRSHVRPAATHRTRLQVEPATRVRSSHPAFICDKCGMRFDTQSELTAHMESHIFRCRICGAGFSNVTDLMRHAREQHFRAQYKCPTCGATFYTDTGLRTHMAQHSSDR